MNAHKAIIDAIEQGANAKQFRTGQIQSRRVARLCLRYWPTGAMPTVRSAQTEAAIESLKSGLHATVKAEYRGSKMNPLVLIFLSPVITYVINALLDWWFGALDRKEMMMLAIEQERIRPEPDQNT